MVPEQVYRVFFRQWDEARRRSSKQQAVTALRLEIAKQRVMRAMRAREAMRVT